MEGWICLYRKLKEHWLWKQDRVFSKFEAWTDILLTANYKEAEVLLGNEIIHLKPGEFITSLRKLADTWKWSVTKVEMFLNMLQKEKMISYKKDTKKTLITIEKWEDYQIEQNEKITQKENEKKTKVKQKETNNKYNNNNNKTNKENIKEKYFENEELNNTFIDYLEMREKKKKPATEKALKIIINKLEEYANNDADRIKILNNSIVNNWTDIYKLKENATKAF